ncbi:type VI secretion system ATPase TssH [Caballeronia sp. LZ033]|uniref:type VI secretion system ATPase TssH n=1 Tax=Caballeronia sp. LZ033 TaxID=3038566 RepID=UPI00285A5B32|nr:type VI secretion system ATPase TssH [Caballeronia sp. LZ033]MDR5816720.1 type VI secretion system ATPase TssH [Caballeronia sp. LZ033]
MISRQTLFGKLGVTLFRGIESAATFCKLRGNPYVELAHWIHQLLQLTDSDLHRIVRHAGIEYETLEQDLVRTLRSLPGGASSISDFSHPVEMAVERAWVIASLGRNERRIRGAWLLAALAGTPELRRELLAVSREFMRLPSENLDETFASWAAGSPEAADLPYDGSAFDPALPGEASRAVSATPEGVLEQYCTDLTALARSGEIDAISGRDQEIRTLTDVLLRRRQNHPLLTGEAGVGKTAVVEGFALAIASGDVPRVLADVRLLSLDVGALLAGASMKGEFEARLKGVLEAASKSPAPVILFVDEIHTLVGAGGQAGTGDAANLLKPALARGAVRIIGATTWAEYKRHIEKDPALTRRFQVLQIAEPHEAAAIEMVRGLAGMFARHHRVIVRDEAIRASVRLSHRYIPSRQLPDKAISLLDTACVRVALSQQAPPRELLQLTERLQAARVELDLLEQEARIGLEPGRAMQEARARIDTLLTEQGALEAHWQAQSAAAEALVSAREAALTPVPDLAAARSRPTPAELRQLEQGLHVLQGETPLVFPEVNEAVVAAVVADWTGIPVGRMVTDEIMAIRALSGTLAARVIGQPASLALIGERIQTARAGLADPHKPVGVFLLAGPSGVGKTETALALAEALYGGEQNLITINMSEYQEAHSVSGLKGAPPGYVGSGEGGVLTEAVRRRPYAVLLLDEIEKAHRDVHEMFFQVFDKGYMEDADGRHIDFRNTTILLTSNAGAERIASLCADPALAPDQDTLQAALTPEMLKTFPPAFLGRVTVVPYRPLAQASLAVIVRLHLNRVVRRMAEGHGISLVCSERLADYIVSRCLVQETGARVLIGFIEKHVLPRLSGLWLDAMAAQRPITRIDADVGDPLLDPAAAIVFALTEPSPPSHAADVVL